MKLLVYRFCEFKVWKYLTDEGTPKLATAPSSLLSAMIAERYVMFNCADFSLPELQRLIFGGSKDIEEDLSGLPESFAEQSQIKLIAFYTKFEL